MPAAHCTLLHVSCTPVFVLHMVVVMHAAAFNQCEQQQAAVQCRDRARGHRLALNPTARMAAAASLLNTGCSTGIPSTYSKAGPVCNPSGGSATHAIYRHTVLTLCLCCCPAGAPWWSWVGGPLGAYYVVINIIFALKLGAGTAVSVFVCSQLAMSIVLDLTGLVGFQKRAFSW